VENAGQILRSTEFEWFGRIPLLRTTFTDHLESGDGHGLLVIQTQRDKTLTNTLRL